MYISSYFIDATIAVGGTPVNAAQIAAPVARGANWILAKLAQSVMLMTLFVFCGILAVSGVLYTLYVLKITKELWMLAFSVPMIPIGPFLAKGMVTEAME